MIGPAITAIKARVEANYTATPLRWQNELWGDPPNNPQNLGLPFIEVEIIGGQNAIVAFSSVGNRLWRHPGLVRFYVFAPQSLGMVDAHATADALALFMERTTFPAPAGGPNGQIVRTGDFSAYDDVAVDESGNYAVLACSCPFDFYYAA